MGMETEKSHSPTIEQLRKKWGSTPETNPDVIEGMKEYWAIVNKK